jgi:CIC family chloride channel protein
VLNAQAFGAAQPLFVAPARTGVYHFGDYVVSALVAIAISTPVALGFGLAMKNTRLVVERANPMLRGMVGGLGTGLVALAVATGLGLDIRHVLGMGDWTLRQLLTHGPGEATAVGLLLVIVVAKMLATAFTVQSGGSAGLLFPSMVLGGTAGAATGRALQLLGLFEGQEVSLFIVVGVASALVGMVGVPMAAIALTLEVFGPAYGPPTILACGLTYVLTLRLSVYDRQEARGRAIDDTGEDEITVPPVQASQVPTPAAPGAPTPPTTPSTVTKATSSARRRRR